MVLYLYGVLIQILKTTIMKKLIIAAVLSAFALYAGASFIKFNEAVVNQEQGIYLFVECVPANEYEFLGDVKHSISFAGSGQFDSVKKDLIKKARKQYPNCNGLIFHFVDGGTDRADAILLK